MALAATPTRNSRKNACEGARENAKKFGFKIVYDKSYPPPPKPPTSRRSCSAIQAANADLVVVCSYPLDSVGMVLAAKEVGLKPKMFGGAHGRPAGHRVQEQARAGKLNGIVNYETWVPDRKDDVRWQPRNSSKSISLAPGGKRRSARLLSRRLGLRASSRCLETRSSGAKSIEDDKIAAYLKKGSFKTVMGPIKFGAKGEWAEGRMMRCSTTTSARAPNLDTWQGMSYQTVLTPAEPGDGQSDLSIREGE